MSNKATGVDYYLSKPNPARQYLTRENARHMARERMKRAGWQHINKKSPASGKSPFALNWKKVSGYNPTHAASVHHRKRGKGLGKNRNLFTPAFN